MASNGRRGKKSRFILEHGTQQLGSYCHFASRSIKRESREGARASVPARLLKPHQLLLSLICYDALLFCLVDSQPFRAVEIEHESNQKFRPEQKAVHNVIQLLEDKRWKFCLWFAFLCVCQIHILFGILIPLEPPTHSTFDRSRPVGGRMRERETINDGIDHCCPARGESID